MMLLEPPVYQNHYGMNEYQENQFIVDTIDEFCKADLHSKLYEDLYDLLYEYILDNLEKFIPEPDCD